MRYVLLVYRFCKRGNRGTEREIKDLMEEEDHQDGEGGAVRILHFFVIVRFYGPYREKSIFFPSTIVSLKNSD